MPEIVLKTSRNGKKLHEKRPPTDAKMNMRNEAVIQVFTKFRFYRFYQLRRILILAGRCSVN